MRDLATVRRDRSRQATWWCGEVAMAPCHAEREREHVENANAFLVISRGP
jgi:hypothetical protein